MSFREALNRGEFILREAGIADFDTDAWLLLEYAAKIDRACFFLNAESEMPDGLANKYMRLIEKRAGRVPLQHITGEQEFMGLRFMVSGDALIPRQDTESLVECLIPKVEKKKVLDVCTGSGCIAISLAKLGAPLSVDAVDRSKKALEAAGKNAALNGARVNFWLSDMFEKVDGVYDVIVSNPPYIRTDQIDELMPEVRDFEPRVALDGGRDGLDFYRIISREAGLYLREGGIAAVEIGCEQGESVVWMFLGRGYDGVSIKKDLSGSDRVVVGVCGRRAKRMAGQKTAKRGSYV